MIFFFVFFDGFLKALFDRVFLGRLSDSEREAQAKGHRGEGGEWFDHWGGCDGLRNGCNDTF